VRKTVSNKANPQFMKGFELLEMHHNKMQNEKAAQKGEDKILRVR